jgi:hydroxymethylbilane synthase
LEIIRTRGDVIQDVSLARIEGKGFFTKELEEALLGKQIDIAVHSLKDLPTQSPPGLMLGAVPVREDPRDVLLVAPHAWEPLSPLLPLKQGVCVGTSAVRRQSQLKHLRNDVVLKDVRGNVPTRIQKLRDGLYDAIVLAQAGLNRLQTDMTGLHSMPLSAMLYTSAPAQGALGIQIRENDARVLECVKVLHHAQTAQVVDAERGVLERFEGGCHLALGAYASTTLQGFDMVAYLEHATYAPSGKRVYVQAPDVSSLVQKTYEALVQP